MAVQHPAADAAASVPRCLPTALNCSIKPPGGESGWDKEASSFLAEGGLVHPDQADQPAEQQVVAELLNQHPLGANAVDRLQQQGQQQLFWRNRGAAALGT